MEDLIKKIEQWAEDRNIIKGTKPIDQAMKLFSEFGELADNVGKGRDCRDDIGDVFTVLTIMAKQIKDGSMLESCNPTYEPEYEWNDNEHPKNIDDKKELVIMLNRDLHILMTSMDYHTITDELNCCVNCLFRMAKLHGCTLEECVQIAYNDIKDRKGIVSNGVFIKESDPVYAQVIAEIEGNYNVG